MAIILDWIAANIGTIIVCAILAAIISLIVVYLIRQRKKGKHLCSCGGCCESCAMGCSCGAAKNDSENKNKKE